MIGEFLDSIRSPFRLAVLNHTGLLQIPPSATIDHLTHLAASVLRVPTALVVLVGADREVIVSSVGLTDEWTHHREIALSHSPSTHVVASGEPLVIEDARVHPVSLEFRPPPGLDLVAFLGVPLTTSEGCVLGTLCVIDHRPRSWNAAEVAILTDVAAALMSAMELEGAARCANRRAEAAELAQWKQAEELLLENDLRFRQEVEGVQDYAIFILDADGHVASWNAGAERIEGYRADDIIGRHFSCFYPREDVENGKPELTLRQALTQGRFETQGWHVRKDGTRFWASVVITPRRDHQGGLRGFTKLVQDITARKRAEDGFRLLVQASDALASSLDYQMTLATVARLAVPTLADWCVVYIVGGDGTIERLSLAHADPDEGATLRAFMEHSRIDPMSSRGVGFVVRTGRSLLAPDISDEALRAFYAENAEFPDYLRRSGLKGAMVVPLVARGRILGALSFASTSTDRRYDDSDLSLAEEIAHRAAVAIDNAALYRQAQEAIQARDAVFASVSHDLRAPLGNIKGYAQLLRRIARTADPSQVDLVVHGAERIDAIATRMTSMINDLLDVARLRLGRDLDLACVPTDLVALTGQIRDQVQETTDQHHIRVVATTTELVGSWDTARLERVVANLVANAIKYSPNGGEITLSVDREDGRDGSWAILEVSDQGIGIPSDDLPHIFEGFRRAANAVGQFSGTGLGLASAMLIVRQHGGHISVRSREGIGSTFTVRLPLPTEPQPA